MSGSGCTTRTPVTLVGARQALCKLSVCFWVCITIASDTATMQPTWPRWRPLSAAAQLLQHVAQPVCGGLRVGDRRGLPHPRVLEAQQVQVAQHQQARCVLQRLCHLHTASDMSSEQRESVLSVRLESSCLSSNGQSG